MVRIINEKNVWILKSAIVKWMGFQKYHTHITEINNPHATPCIYALWHANQCCIFGIKNKHNTSIMISNSLDGEIITAGVESLGIKTVRGSSNKRGSVEATMQLIERLKAGEDAALTIDGPSGPYHKVKNGIIKIAKLSGCPIIPLTWYSEKWCFITFPSWDKMTLPIWDTNLINLYGEPIYIPKDLPDSEYGPYKEKLKNALENLDKIAPEEFKKAKKKDLWKISTTPI